MNRKIYIIGIAWCFLAGLLCIWTFTGQYIQQHLPLDRFTKCSGTLADIHEVGELRSRSVDSAYDLHLRLEGDPGYYRIMGIYSYNTFLGNLNTGDRITLYIRPSWLLWLGYGRKGDVFQLEKEGKVLFELRSTYGNSKGIRIVTAIGALVFFASAIWLLRYRKYKE